MKVLVADNLSSLGVDILKKESGIDVDVNTGLTREELIKIDNDYGELLTHYIKKFIKEFSISKIDLIYDYSLKNGAMGGKITGAGGGGHLILYCEGKKQKSLISKLQKKGLILIESIAYPIQLEVHPLSDSAPQLDWIEGTK